LFLGLADYAHGWDHRNAAVRSGNRQLVGLLFKATTRGEALLRSKSKFTFNEKAEQGWELDVAPAAARKGDSEMLKLLLDHGVKPRCLLTLGNAAKSGNLECVQMLIDRGYCFQNVRVCVHAVLAATTTNPLTRIHHHFILIRTRCTSVTMPTPAGGWWDKPPISTWWA
jgi:hypothetical protein